MQKQIKFYKTNIAAFNELKNYFPEIIARALSNRGVKDYKEASFDYPVLSYKDLKDIKSAIKSLEWAFDNNKKIVVVADYDCDGATSCAIAVRVLKKIGLNVDFIVPDRMTHGYGISPAIVDLCKEKEADMIVTVDNGIAAFDGVEAAKKENIKIVVTDHHLQGDDKPECDALVNPNQQGCVFTSKNIAGCGVIFYVLSAFKDYLVYKKKIKHFSMYEFMDLLAVGTIADVVKLDNNNRALVWMGLEKLRQNPCVGLKALSEVSYLDYKTISTKDIGFSLAPKINAAGRIAHMRVGIECLITNNFEEAKIKAQQLNDINTERKQKQNDMLDMAKSTLIKAPKKTYSKIIFDESFHEGVIGIVAGRLKEKYYAPSIVFAAGEDGNYKGSCRSIPGFHIRDALDYIHKNNPNMILKFGGHAMAAGLSLNADKFTLFKQEFEKICQSWIPEEKRKSIVMVDGKLSGSEINDELLGRIKYYLWGTGFEEPTFYGDFTVKKVSWLKQRHLKLVLEKDGYDFEAMWFFAKQDVDKDKIDMVYQLENGMNGLMLSVVDII